MCYIINDGLKLPWAALVYNVHWYWNRNSELNGWGWGGGVEELGHTSLEHVYMHKVNVKL